MRGPGTAKVIGYDAVDVVCRACRAGYCIDKADARVRDGALDFETDVAGGGLDEASQIGDIAILCDQPATVNAAGYPNYAIGA